MWEFQRKEREKAPGFPRERQARWDLEHLRTASTKMIPEEYRMFRALCAARKTTAYTVLRTMARRWMMEVAREDPRAAAEAVAAAKPEEDRG